MTFPSGFAVYAEQINNAPLAWGYVYVHCERESFFVALLVLIF